MLKQKKWFVVIAFFFMGLALELFSPEGFVRTANADAYTKIAGADTFMGAVEKKAGVFSALNTEDIWKNVYHDIMYSEELSDEKLVAFALAGVKEHDLKLMSSSTDHIVNYHGRRFAITDDEYQVLLKIVEAEAPDEDTKGKMLVANVVLNRLELGFGGDTISEVVFAKGQFEPVKNGRIFRVTPSEATIEAVERVLDGEDESKGALYFMARNLASKRGVKWFDENLEFLFKHGGHEFYKEKK